MRILFYFVMFVISVAMIGLLVSTTPNRNLMNEIQKFPNLVEWHIGYKSDVYKTPYYATLFVQIDTTQVFNFYGNSVEEIANAIHKLREDLKKGPF